ncbi:MAG: hypothetical protein ACD_80C00078G0002 [uncultured bacterium (gcode 4)]|uniref:Uncharacterized protein n=1 Tax=uncultured bacterium (gcode 4) TaxID=1234023 RepID=K1XYC8_9BACT|nr:MAG: hypothetical protein ACD_80C00078G0002 [uncultured bacterium (gcode 4)]
MKKIISILLLIVFVSSNFSFAQTNNTSENIGTVGAVCLQNMDCEDWLECIFPADTGGWTCGTKPTTSNPPTSVMGISCNEDQLVNGQCKLNIYDTLGIRKSVRNQDDATSVGLFVQDIVLSATFFIGTLVTVALVVSGLMFIFASSSGKDPADAKKGIMGSLLGLLIVVSSYVIIRLVQYIAKGF